MRQSRPPSDIDEPITIVPCDSGWPVLFDRDRHRIEPLPSAMRVTGIEHSSGAPPAPA